MATAVMPDPRPSLVSTIPTTEEVRAAIAARSVELRVLRQLLKVAESRRRLMNANPSPPAGGGQTQPEASHAPAV